MGNIANTVITLRKSGVSGNVPSSLNYGELGLNYADGILYYKSASGTVKSFSGSGANSFATVIANSSLILASSNNDILTINGANGVSVIANTLTKTITIDGSIAFAEANLAWNLANSAYAYANTLALSGGSIDTYARITANAAFNEANVAWSLANSAYARANTGGGYPFLDMGLVTDPLSLNATVDNGVLT